MAGTKQHYEVAIAGGGIAGVTLALMLERLNISYILLEARDTLESDRGAGIGLQPNGLRILDQLGLIDEIEQATVPLKKWFSYDGEGNLMAASNAMGHYRERIGYPVAFIERPKLLPIMVRRLQRTECVKTSSRVVSVEETKDHVVVKTSNGLSFTADMVVGADGVRSAVRNHIDSFHGQKISSADGIQIAFSTVYGMSKPTAGITAGERFAVYRAKETIIGFTGHSGIVFWFVFDTLSATVPLAQAPRYTPADAEALCQSVAHVRVMPRLRFGDLFHNRVVGVKIAVEEGLAAHWHTDRAVLVGDAACKTTPAGGQGANQAIESCAVLVNKLMAARRVAAAAASSTTSSARLPREAIRSALASYAEVRMPAAATTLERSQTVCKALLCVPGPGTQMVKDMLGLSDEDWLLRVFMALSAAPVLEDVELTDRGQLYDRAVRAAREEMERRRNAGGVEEKGLAGGVKERERKVEVEVGDVVSPVQAAGELVEVS